MLSPRKAAILPRYGPGKDPQHPEPLGCLIRAEEVVEESVAPGYFAALRDRHVSLAAKSPLHREAAEITWEKCYQT